MLYEYNVRMDALNNILIIASNSVKMEELSKFVKAEKTILSFLVPPKLRSQALDTAKTILAGLVATSEGVDDEDTSKYGSIPKINL